MLPTVRQASGVKEYEGDAGGLQEDLAMLKVRMIVICCEQIFDITMCLLASTYPTRS